MSGSERSGEVCYGLVRSRAVQSSAYDKKTTYFWWFYFHPFPMQRITLQAPNIFIHPLFSVTENPLVRRRTRIYLCSVSLGGLSFSLVPRTQHMCVSAVVVNRCKSGCATLVYALDFQLSCCVCASAKLLPTSKLQCARANSD